MTFMEGFYGTGAGLVNLGITGTRNIKISDQFELPVRSSLVVNPQAQKIFLVLGVTL